MKVTVYTTATCPFCKMLMAFLDENKISYVEKKVDIDASAAEEMSQASGGFLGVPFTLIDKDDGRRDTVIGFDMHKLEIVLGIK